MKTNQKLSTSRNKREGYYLGKHQGEHFRSDQRGYVGHSDRLFAAWCWYHYGWRSKRTIDKIGELNE